MRAVLLFSFLLLVGCASAPEHSVRQMRLMEADVDGQSRLFSTFGFWVLGEPLKTRLLACYSSEGHLDRVKLRESLPDAQIIEASHTVSVTLPSGEFASFLLRDGPLVSIDPKADEAVRMVAEQFSSSGRIPIIPIPVR